MEFDNEKLSAIGVAVFHYALTERRNGHIAVAENYDRICDEISEHLENCGYWESESADDDELTRVVLKNSTIW